MGKERWTPDAPAPNNPFAALAGMKDTLPSEGGEAPEEPPREPQRAPSSQFAPKVVVRQERKGHGGKTVTRVSGILLRGEARDALVKALKSELGCSGRLEGDDVLLGGKVAGAAARWLEARGAAKVVVG